MTESKNEGDELMKNLKNSFFRGTHNFILQSTDANFMTWDWQQEFLDSTVNSALVQKYPMSKHYVRIFLKKIIDYLEGSQLEVHDNFYSHLCDAINNTGTDSFCYRHYLINGDSEIVTIKETNNIVVNGTTGMKTWEAALMLADWALCHREKFTNKTILELGSGVGFTGITIAKLCQPQCLYMTDCHPDVLKTIGDNISINFAEVEINGNQEATLFLNEGRTVGVMPLDWNSIEELPENIIPDIVIGADIVYDPSILQPLCDVLKELFTRNQHLEVYIASVVRNEETFESFLTCLDNMKFVYEKLYTIKSVFIEWDHTINTCMLQIGNK